MSSNQIPGYTLGEESVPDAPISTEEFDQLQQSVMFSEHEGSYLVGMMAAMASESNTVSFVGGMDVPLIRKFACGFVQGVKATNPDATVLENMTGTTPAAWSDPAKGAELARSQIDRGADVIYHAAGGTGIGVIRATADQGKLAIEL